MNSDFMASSDYTSDENILYGSHTITLVSDKVSYESNTGKFIINYATPNEPNEKAYDKKYSKNSTSNIVNKSSNLGTTNITKSNYIELKVPKYLFYITDLSIQTNVTTGVCESCGIVQRSCNPQIKITRKEFYKGQKFSVINEGGQLDSPLIIGVVE